VAEIDRWGLDPSVQAMRRVFSKMETAQIELLEKLNISRFDKRLRPAQDKARNLFEKTWSLAAKRGIEIGEKQVLILYTHCLGRALIETGFEIDSIALSDNNDFDVLIEEIRE